MELPKNITQIGETNPHCKIYVEDYVISYIKQLNSYACDKTLAVALYGIRKEEAGITYIFLYGAGKLNFLQKECRHLSQAVLQEAEKQRMKFFPEYVFLGYKLLDGEMVEGFYVCEQNVCRSIEGYAQFYEKNDKMLAFMLEERQTDAVPEKVDQDKYDMVKKRQEERRALVGEKSGHAFRTPIKLPKMAEPGGANLRNMRMAAAAAFVLLGVAGLAAMGGGERLGDLQIAARQWMEEISQKQLPDMVEVSNGTAQAGTIVAEDKLTDAILKENEAAGNPDSDSEVPVQDGRGQSGPGGIAAEPGQTQPDPDTGQTNPEPTAPTAPDTAPTTPDATMPPTPETGQTTPDISPDITAPSNPASDREPAEPSEPMAPETGQTTPDTALPSDSASAQEPDRPPSESGGNQGESAAEEPSVTEPVSYTIRKGDTLIGICIRKYGSDERVAEICSLNHISNPDDIKEGAEILLP